MRMLLTSVLAALVGCPPAYTVSQYRTDAANPALIELRARDAFRNSDRMTLSVGTRAPLRSDRFVGILYIC